MPPRWPRIVYNDDLAARLDDAEHLAQRPLAPFARLLVKQEEYECWS